MLRVVGRSLADAASVLVRAAWLLGRHWPVLAAIYLLGAVGHDGILWLCVWLSNDHRTAAGFLLPLVPIATLTSLILMLRQLTPDLAHVRPALADLVAPEAVADPVDPSVSRAERMSAARPSRRERVRARFRRWRNPTHARLVLLASALIPFMTVYVSQDWLKDDINAFVNAAIFDETRTDVIFDTASVNPDRIFIADGALLFGIVAGAFVVRWVLGRSGLAGKVLALGLVAAYVEVLWVFQLAGQFEVYRAQVADWVAGRQLTEWLLTAWQWVVQVLGPYGDPVERAGSWLWTALGQLDDVIVIPIAWLTVGAVVYGRSVAARERERTARLERWQNRVQRVPGPVRRVGNEFTATVRDRFQSLGNGIRLLARAGLAPMLLFCVVFLLAAQVEKGIEALRRLLLGPMDVYDALTITPPLSVISRGAYLVVLVVLLGAAVDRILARAEEDGLVEAAEPVTDADPGTAGVPETVGAVPGPLLSPPTA